MCIRDRRKEEETEGREGQGGVASVSGTNALPSVKPAHSLCRVRKGFGCALCQGSALHCEIVTPLELYKNCVPSCRPLRISIDPSARVP
eukprot:2149563-Pyramimonas_sp.AAC.1